jgi:hypothetical protein
MYRTEWRTQEVNTRQRKDDYNSTQILIDNSLFPAFSKLLTVVPSDEGVSVLGLELSVDKLFGLLESNVQKAVQTSQYSSVFYPRIQLNSDRPTQNRL